MNEANKYRFPLQALNKPMLIAMQQGFSIKEDSLIAWTAGQILEDLPEEIKKVFPVNIEKMLLEMDSDLEIVHKLKVNTRQIFKEGEKELKGNEFDELTKAMFEGSTILLPDKKRNPHNYRFISEDDTTKKGLFDGEKRNIRQLLREWAMGNTFSVNGKKYWVVEGAEKRTREMERFLEIQSLAVKIQIVKKGIGDAICNFYVTISPKGEIGIAGSSLGLEEGRWELLIEGWEETPEGGLSFEEVVEKLKIATEKFEREKQEQAMVEVKVTEGFQLLSA